MDVGAFATHSAGPTISQGPTTRPPSHAFVAQLHASSSSSSAFAVMLRRLRSREQHAAVVTPAIEPLDALLLSASPSVLLSLVASAREYVEEAEGKAMAAAASHDPPKKIFSFDSGSQIHLLTLETAREYFFDHRVSNLRVLGVSGTKAADLEGHLVLLLAAPDGTQHHLDLGVAHGMAGCPLNLLSVSLLIKMGASLHFEEGNCYFRLLLIRSVFLLRKKMVFSRSRRLEVT